jgi:hypothetical protein
VKNCKDGGKCAKKAPDLKETCRIRPNWKGRPFCIKNGGRGFDKVVDCEGERCAKADAGLTVECVLARMVHED